jgi:phage terminase large subunit-like protein
MDIPYFLARRVPKLVRFLRTAMGLLTLSGIIVFGTLGYNGRPHFYWYMILAVAPLFGWVSFRRAVPIAQAFERARRRWKARGADVERVRYTRFAQLRSNFAEVTRDETQGYVDDRTWVDLGVETLLERIDVCFTMAGRNELYRLLRHSLPDDAAVNDRRSLMALLRDDDSERLRLATALARVGEESDADPADLLWSDTTVPDDLYPLFIGMSLFSVGSIGFTIFVNPGAGVLALIVAFIANMWIYYRKARFLSVHVPALRVLSRMIDQSRTLDWGELPALRAETGSARRAFAWLLTGAPSPSPSLSGDIMEMLFLYVKIFFQIDLIAFNRILRVVRAHQDAYRRLYRSMGEMDALYALASYRARRRTTCDAVAGPSAETRIVLQEAYHPLLKKAVSSSVKLGLPGAIITGTNMAGKSTFLRMLGINALFAQSVGYTFAAGYSGRRFRIMSSIEKQDDLSEGRSFYFDEAERIFRMIERTGEQEPVLLLIDELLSGTNSLERESASIAILHYLSSRNALTVAATHDVAIAEGVRDRYALYHFTDQADESGLFFDYTLHEGVVQTRNAIKLLRIIGYPEDVIEEAMRKTDRS